MKTLSRTIVSALLCITAQSGFTQQDRGTLPADAENWYQVHVAIFGHRSDAGEYEEAWRNNLQLKYPPNLIRLKTKDRYLAELCGLTPSAVTPGTTTNSNRLLDILERVDSGEGYQASDYPEIAPTLTAENVDPACKQVRPDLFPPDRDHAANNRAVEIVASAESLLSDKAPSEVVKSSDAKKTPQALTPYILSEQISDEEFAGLVRKLKGAYRYKLLFSGSWPQPLQARSQANALLIEGGEAVGQHHELEGYIRIGLERYLHIDTELWLSKFSPQGRRIPEASYPPVAGNDYSAAQSTSTQSVVRRKSEFPALPTPFPINDKNVTPPREQQHTSTEDFYRQRASEQEHANTTRPSSNLDLLSANDSSYFVDRTVVMRQNRRMRSNEVHYLDHPLFGVLIKITPIAAPAETSLSQR